MICILTPKVHVFNINKFSSISRKIHEGLLLFCIILFLLYSVKMFIHYSLFFTFHFCISQLFSILYFFTYFSVFFIFMALYSVFFAHYFLFCIPHPDSYAGSREDSSVSDDKLICCVDGDNTFTIRN